MALIFSSIYFSSYKIYAHVNLTEVNATVINKSSSMNHVLTYISIRNSTIAIPNIIGDTDYYMKVVLDNGHVIQLKIHDGYYGNNKSNIYDRYILGKNYIMKIDNNNILYQ